MGARLSRGSIAVAYIHGDWQYVVFFEDTIVADATFGNEARLLHTDEEKTKQKTKEKQITSQTTSWFTFFGWIFIAFPFLSLIFWVSSGFGKCDELTLKHQMRSDSSPQPNNNNKMKELLSIISWCVSFTLTRTIPVTNQKKRNKKKTYVHGDILTQKNKNKSPAGKGTHTHTHTHKKERGGGERREPHDRYSSFIPPAVSWRYRSNIVPTPSATTDPACSCSPPLSSSLSLTCLCLIYTRPLLEQAIPAQSTAQI